MAKLISHPDLFVMQTEYSIYVLLKFWVYMLVNPEDNEEPPSSKEVNNYFCSRKSNLYIFLLLMTVCIFFPKMPCRIY